MMDTQFSQEAQVKELVSQVLDDMRQRPIPIGVSNHHIHLSRTDYAALFPGHDLTVKKTLLQPGQFAAEETVTLTGPKGSLHHVRILGPLRQYSQVELSRTDARTLGLTAPLRLSGTLAETPGIRVISPYAEITLPQGVIVALRHIHMAPLDALVFGVQHGDRVKVAILGSDRKTIFDDVAIRVAPDMSLELHVDTDEANAADIDHPGAYAMLVQE